MNNWGNLFKDEKDFTFRLVMPWLKSKGYQDVRYIGGTDEYGRDVIFSKEKLDGEKEWFGVQVKYGKIKGKHVGKYDIQELISQAKTAITTPLPIEQGKSEVKISEVIILTNESVTRQAKTILRAGLENIPHTIFDIVDIDNSFKQEKVEFSKGAVLIRSPSELNFEEMSELNLEVYKNEPSNEFFESEKDVYFDYTKEFDDLNELLKFMKELEKREINENFIKIFLEIPPIFNLHEIKGYFDVYFKDKQVDIFEEEDIVNIEHKYSKNSYREVAWLEDVNNMQILQKK